MEHSYITLRPGSASPISSAVAKISDNFYLVTAGIRSLPWSGVSLSMPHILSFSNTVLWYCYQGQFPFFLTVMLRDPLGRDSVASCKGWPSLLSFIFSNSDITLDGTLRTLTTAPNPPGEPQTEWSENKLPAKLNTGSKQGDVAWKEQKWICIHYNVTAKVHDNCDLNKL